MLLALVCSHRPVASLVWRGGWSHLEHCRAAEKLNEAGKAFFGLSFSVINKGPHCDFMLCTALALLPVFTIQHWLSFGPCSYLPCIYSSHVILVSLFRGVDRPPRPPLPPPPPGYRSVKPCGCFSWHPTQLVLMTHSNYYTCMWCQVLPTMVAASNGTAKGKTKCSQLHHSVLARPLLKGTVPFGLPMCPLWTGLKARCALCPLITLATTWNTWLGKASPGFWILWISLYSHVSVTTCQ